VIFALQTSSLKTALTRKLLRTIIIIVVLASNVGCDQVTKSIARERLTFSQDINVIGNHFILTRVENTGAFLSLGSSLPHMARFILLTILPIIILCGAMTYLVVRRDLPPLFSVGLAFIVGGGIGNLYDRVLYGSVTDFLHIDLVWFRTGVFNMADVSVMVGMGIMIVHTLVQRKHRTSEEL
jgi:signal peptidase II